MYVWFAFIINVNGATSHVTLTSGVLDSPFLGVPPFLAPSPVPAVSIQAPYPDSAAAPPLQHLSSPDGCDGWCNVESSTRVAEATAVVGASAAVDDVWRSCSALASVGSRLRN